MGINSVNTGVILYRANFLKRDLSLIFYGYLWTLPNVSLPPPLLLLLNPFLIYLLKKLDEFGRNFKVPMVPTGFFGHLMIRLLSTHLITLQPLLYWRYGFILTAASARYISIAFTKRPTKNKKRNKETKKEEK